MDNDELDLYAVYETRELDPKLVKDFAGAVKRYIETKDEAGNVVAYRFVVQHPRYPDLFATVEYPDDREGELPFFPKRTIIDKGDSPILAISEIARYTESMSRNAVQTHKGGAPKGTRPGTPTRRKAAALRYFHALKSDPNLSQEEFAKKDGIPFRTLQRAISEYPKPEDA